MLSSLSLSGYFTTWRIVPVRKWLGSPIYKPFSPIGRGPITLLRALILTMVISYWPLTSNGMILQVPSKFKKKPKQQDIFSTKTGFLDPSCFPTDQGMNHQNMQERYTTQPFMFSKNLGGSE